MILLTFEGKITICFLKKYKQKQKHALFYTFLNDEINIILRVVVIKSVKMHYLILLHLDPNRFKSSVEDKV